LNLVVHGIERDSDGIVDEKTIGLVKALLTRQRTMTTIGAAEECREVVPPGINMGSREKGSGGGDGG
jgi:hypothetical protein